MNRFLIVLIVRGLEWVAGKVPVAEPQNTHPAQLKIGRRRGWLALLVLLLVPVFFFATLWSFDKLGHALKTDPAVTGGLAFLTFIVGGLVICVRLYKLERRWKAEMRQELRITSREYGR